MAAESQKFILKWLSKVAMSRKLLVFEVMNEKLTLFHFILIIQKQSGNRPFGPACPHTIHNIRYQILNIHYFSDIFKINVETSLFFIHNFKTSKLWLIAILPNLIKRHLMILQPQVLLSFFVKMQSFCQKQRKPLRLKCP